MNNYVEHFRKELEILRRDGEELIIDNLVPDIEKLLNAFSKEGHSGGSAGFAIPILVQTIERSLKFEPLSPIKEDDDNYQNNQNTRLSSLFKYEECAYYTNAIIWRGENSFFSGMIDGITSSQDVNFPFTPKTFYIDVEEGHIKDHTQLAEVWEYYKQPDLVELLLTMCIKRNYYFKYNGGLQGSTNFKDFLEFIQTSTSNNIDEYQYVIDCFRNILKKEKESKYKFYFYWSLNCISLEIDRGTGTFKKVKLPMNVTDDFIETMDISEAIEFINNYLEKL